MSIKSQYGNKAWPQWIIAGWKREIKLVIQIMQHTGAVQRKSSEWQECTKVFFFFMNSCCLKLCSVRHKNGCHLPCLADKLKDKPTQSISKVFLLTVWSYLALTFSVTWRAILFLLTHHTNARELWSFSVCFRLQFPTPCLDDFSIDLNALLLKYRTFKESL